MPSDRNIPPTSNENAPGQTIDPTASGDNKKNSDNDKKNTKGELETIVKIFGKDFEPYVPTAKQDVLTYIAANTRKDTTPGTPNPWQCRIGGSLFYVPPINVKMSRVSGVGAMGGAIRQMNSPKFNSGHSETMLSITLYFPTHETIWGFDGNTKTINFDKDPDGIIDTFLSSLRGLIAQFKYSPFLPIVNQHINQELGINAVALQSMSVSTIPNFPFAVAVQLNMMKFNHKTFLPMIETFDEAIHWGKFRQYMGRAANKLSEIAGEGFLTDLASDEDLTKEQTQDKLLAEARKKATSYEGSFTFDKVKEFRNGKDFDLYYPAHTPAHIAYPDLTGFRAPEDDQSERKKKEWWQETLGFLGIDYAPDSEAAYENYNIFYRSPYASNYLRDELRLLASWLDTAKLLTKDMSQTKLNEYTDRRIQEYRTEHPDVSEQTLDALREQIKNSWLAVVYQSFIDDPYLDKVFGYQQFDRKSLLIREWEVPMRKLELDPEMVIVESVSAQMGNNFAKIQLQMNDEPSYQHIGGLDTSIEISLLVFDGNNLQKINRLIEHINGLARLEHGHGVLGFAGVKNLITALCGMKYCMIQEYSTETIPNFPGVTRVTLTLVDFDVFQQKREMLSSEQQADLISAFSKRNPFLRLKQHWGAFNAYPDFPLGVRDENGKLVGHLDPDFYFKGFKTIDEHDTDFKAYDSKVSHVLLPDDENPKLGHGVEISKEGLQFIESGKGSGVYEGWYECNADRNLNKASTPGLTPYSQYGTHYVDGTSDPTNQFELMFKDSRYRDRAGRMLRAFPTYMLWLIDEGGNFAGMKLFDNFYGLQSVMDIACLSSEDSMDDTLIMQISNLYSRLSTKYRDLIDESVYENAHIINEQINKTRNLASGLTDFLVNLDTVELKPGVRVHLRMGYGANPNALETVFNGTITEVELGEVITVTCQSDTIELSQIINDSKESGHTGTIDGSLMSGFWLSEPRDLMIRLLTMGSSTVKEAIAHATRGKVFSENRFGIKHFGSMMYDPLTEKEKELTNLRNNKLGETMSATVPGGQLNSIIKEKNDSADALTDSVTDITGVFGADNLGQGIGRAIQGISGFIDFGAIDIMTSLAVNFYKKRDYELFKRNIYPGNGTGIAQYEGGDLGDGGMAMGFMPSGLSPDGKWTDPASGDLNRPDTPDHVIDNNNPNHTQPTELPGTSAIPGVSNKQTKDAAHPFLQMLGIQNKVGDDDVQGADEVSFRAQTYMKSVWDIFQVCAALLPNYIVAVRPFEERSTIFYGKPHWNWTSAVIPVSTGTVSMKISDPDQNFTDVMKNLDIHKQEEKTKDEEFYDRVASASSGVSSDPGNGVSGMNWNGGDVFSLKSTAPGITPGSKDAVIPVQTGIIVMEMHLPTSPNLQTDISQHRHRISLTPELSHPFYMDRSATGTASGEQGGRGGSVHDQGLDKGAVVSGDHADWPGRQGAFGILSPEVEEFYMNMRWPYTKDLGSKSDKGSYAVLGDVVTSTKKVMVYNKRNKKGVICTIGDWGPGTKAIAGISPDAALAIEMHNLQDECFVGFVEDDAIPGPVTFGGAENGTGTGKGNETATGPTNDDLLPKWFKDAPKKNLDQLNDKTSVAEYALRFGYTDPNVEVNYTKKKDGKIILLDNPGSAAALVYSNRTEDQANDIWKEFRTNFAEEGMVKDMIKKKYGDKITDEQLKTVASQFIQWMWENPWNRGWLVKTADAQFTLGNGFVGDLKNAAGTPDIVDKGLDAVGNVLDTLWGGSDSAKKDWNFDRAHAALEKFLNEGPDATTAWMKENDGPGKNETGLISRTVEEFKTKVIDKIITLFGSIFKAVGAAVTGVLALTRLSMMTLNNGLNMGSFMQKQANALNKDFDDSIYYNAGPPGSLTYFCDNPFTREYGEPVIEVREPFQKLHLLSSFRNMIDNNIIEQMGAATVVTATSNGKHPRTVYFDKGAPSDKQVEMMVESGLFFDNPGTFGRFIHPIEQLREWSKKFNGDTDTTSAKRVAAYHMKESLKDIYSGEILIIGDPSIRPHDLIYIGDVYNKIYGICEVEKVVHHLNPEMGFITAITPNALVTIEDPARWTMMSYIRARVDTWNVRNDLKHTYKNQFDREGMNIPAQQSLIEFSRGIDTQLKGTLQYTNGNSALVRDLQAARNTSQLVPKKSQIPDLSDDTAVGAVNDGVSDWWSGPGHVTGAKIGFAGAATSFGGPVAGIAVWKAWDWVKDKLQDQHTCYVQYLTKEGKPMDAGLSYNHGVAVGQQRTMTLFGNSLRIPVHVNDKEGHSMIATNDLLQNLGWEPAEIDEMVGDADLFVNEVNAQIYNLAGRPSPASDPRGAKTQWVTVTNVVDGDTFDFTPPIEGTDISRVRLGGVDAPEINSELKSHPERAALLDPNDSGVQSFLWLTQVLLGKQVALRFEEGNSTDIYGNRVVAFVFYRTDETDPDERKKILMGYAENNTGIRWDSYQSDGVPYTVNWESVLRGHSNVYLFGLDSDNSNEGVEGGRNDNNTGTFGGN